MAAKTPVLDPRNSIGLENYASTPRVAHARPNLLSAMHRRAKGNAGRMLRYTKAGKVRKGRA